MNWGKTAGLSHSSESSASGQGPPEPSPGTVTLSVVCQHPWRVSSARQEGFLVAKEAEVRAKACGERGEGAARRGNGTKGGVPGTPGGCVPKGASRPRGGFGLMIGLGVAACEVGSPPEMSWGAG